MSDTEVPQQSDGSSRTCSPGSNSSSSGSENECISAPPSPFTSFAKRFPHSCNPHWADDKPAPWTIDRYIRSHYRPRLTLWQCVRSAFVLHNETFNIWSHFFGAVLFGWVFRRHRLHDAQIDAGLPPSALFPYGKTPLAVYVNILPILTTFCFSTLAHTFSPHSAALYNALFTLDRSSIMLMTCCNNIAAWMTAMAHKSARFHATMSACFGALYLVTVWGVVSNRFPNWVELLLFALQYCLSAYPIQREIWRHASNYPKFVAKLVKAAVLAYTALALAGLSWASHLPEAFPRFWGRLHLIGTSHNLLHVFAVLSALVGHNGILMWQKHIAARNAAAILKQ